MMKVKLNGTFVFDKEDMHNGFEPNGIYTFLSIIPNHMFNSGLMCFIQNERGFTTSVDLGLVERFIEYGADDGDFVNIYVNVVVR